MSLPTMRARMVRQQKSAQMFATQPEPEKPTSQGHVEDHVQMPEQDLQHRRNVSSNTLAPSFDSSTCSELSAFTDYGLARALNAKFVVPNVENPIATVKDRKSAMYIETTNNRHRQLEAEMNEARASRDKITQSRDKNTQDLLTNRDYIEANTLVAQRARSYDEFFRGLGELKDLPKMPREELEWRYTYQKKKQQRNYEDLNTVSAKEQARDFEDQIADLHLEREDLEEKLASHTLKLRDAASQADRYFKNIDQLMEDNAYYQHASTVCKRDIDSITNELHASQVDAHNTKQRLGLAISELNQLRADKGTLGNQVQSLLDENTDLHNEIGRFYVEVTGLIDGREDAEEDRADQRQEIIALRQEQAMRDFERSQLMAELAFLKSGNTRRDSVVSRGSHDGPMS